MKRRRETKLAINPSKAPQINPFTRTDLISWPRALLLYISYLVFGHEKYMTNVETDPFDAASGESAKNSSGTSPI